MLSVPDEQPPVEGTRGGVNADILPQQENPDLGGPYEVTPEKLFAIARAAVTGAQSSDLSKRRSAMARSWRAYNNRHSEGSKYLHANFSARSKNFVPKTRSSVIKNMVAAATALFSTDDVVSVRAENDADPRQLASADLHRFLLNYRLGRTSHRSGLPWFHISMAAVQDTRIAGFCVSKQHWEFEEIEEEFEVEPDMTTGEPVVIGMDGQPVQIVKKRRKLRDRPMIELQPTENVVVDMTAPFWDVVQGGAFFIVRIPMHVADVKAMMQAGRQYRGGGPWHNIPDQVLGAAVQDSTGAAVRSARGAGSDRLNRTNIPKVSDLDIVWVHENFVRCEGRDFHFWSLDTRRLLSEPKETVEAYPAHHGERPYVLGVGAIEAHSALPMSTVESLSPIQDEINDVRNLTLDTLKQGISPIAMVRRGKQVDLRQLRQRGPDATVLVSDVEADIKFDRAPTPGAEAFVMMDRLNVEADELTGSFSTSAVQSNRNLNETVGGMRMLSGSANSVQEFDLRIFVETWVEPALRHIVWLEQYYETDEKLIALAGEKAGLFQKYGQDVELDPLLEEEVTVRVNVGIGAADPMQKMQKLGMAMKMGMELAATGAVKGQVVVKAEEILDEIFGLAGYNEADRFFNFTPPEEAEQKQPPDPAMLKIQADQQTQQAKLEFDKQKSTDDHALKDVELKLKQAEVELKRIELQQQQMMGQADLQFRQASQDREIALREREIGQQQMLGQADMQFKRESQGRELELREREIGQGAQHADRDYSLRAAAQNKQIVDEEMTAPMPGPEGSAPVRATPKPSALEQTVQAMAGIAAQMAQGMQAIMQAQVQTDARMATILAQISAPKRVVRDESNQIVGVEPVGAQS